MRSEHNNNDKEARSRRQECEFGFCKFDWYHPVGARPRAKCQQDPYNRSRSGYSNHAQDMLLVKSEIGSPTQNMCMVTPMLMHFHENGYLTARHNGTTMRFIKK